MEDIFHKPVEPAIEKLVERIDPFFSIYEIEKRNGEIHFFGIPKQDFRGIYENIWYDLFENGYQFMVKHELGEYQLIVSPVKPVKERRWINVVLAIATFVTTMVMGSFMFGADPVSDPVEVFKGLPFTIAIMAVLGAHESGHYLVAKKHGMHTSLPYFIPFPSLIGTMGAVIKHRGPIPNRKALFDVGVSGPLIGLIVSVIVSIIGLLQPALSIPEEGAQIILSLPPLFELLTRFIPLDETAPLHPVAFAGWVGMLVTALNLIPAGQLDGGHVLRAMLGEKASHVSNVLPFLLISLGFYVTFILNKDGFLWLFWGFLLSIFAASGHPKPLNDNIRLGRRRMLLGVITFILGLLCITLTPFQIQ